MAMTLWLESGWWHCACQQLVGVSAGGVVSMQGGNVALCMSSTHGPTCLGIGRHHYHPWRSQQNHPWRAGPQLCPSDCHRLSPLSLEWLEAAPAAYVCAGTRLQVSANKVSMQLSTGDQGAAWLLVQADRQPRSMHLGPGRVAERLQRQLDMQWGREAGYGAGCTGVCCCSCGRRVITAQSAPTSIHTSSWAS
jgi:hypothetical protein